jgi:hypothetical protein
MQKLSDKDMRKSVSDATVNDVAVAIIPETAAPVATR